MDEIKGLIWMLARYLISYSVLSRVLLTYKIEDCLSSMRQKSTLSNYVDINSI